MNLQRARGVLNFIVFICCMLFISCSNMQELDAWPFVYYEKDAEKQETSLDILTSFYSYRDNPKETTYAFRPFYIGNFLKIKIL